MTKQRTRMSTHVFIKGYFQNGSRKAFVYTMQGSGLNVWRGTWAKPNKVLLRDRERDYQYANMVSVKGLERIECLCNTYVYGVLSQYTYKG